MTKLPWKHLIVVALTIGLLGNGGGEKDGKAGAGCTMPAGPKTKVTGTVFAPGGVIAFNGPTLSERLLALAFGKSAHAAISGTSPVGNAPVRLIEINASGAQVGPALATGTTAADGTFTLLAPASFVPGSQFVVRGTGTTGTLDAIVTRLAGLEVDPSTEATKQLVLASVQAVPGATLAAVQTLSVVALQNTVVSRLSSIDLSAALTATAWSVAIRNAVQADPELKTQADSLAASGGFTGQVSDASGGIANVEVLAFDFITLQQFGKTLTDANGFYRLNVPPKANPGYVVSARNTGTASSAASEYFKAVGHGRWALEADEVTVVAGAFTSANFQLLNGARLTGRVLAGNTGAPLSGVKVFTRAVDAASIRVVWTETGVDGSYNLNVPVGINLVLTTVNETLQPYGSVTYNGPAAGSSTPVSGVLGIDRGTILAPTAGSTVTADFALPVGRKVTGILTVGPTTSDTPVYTFVNVSDSIGAFSSIISSDVSGKYRIWLPQGASYILRTRGQTGTANLSAGDAVVDFIAPVQTNSLIVRNSTGSPVSAVVVSVHDANNNFAFEGNEASRSDGAVTVYTAAPGTPKRILFAVDSALSGIGSSVFLGATSFGSGTSVLLDGSNLGTVTLPPGAMLGGKVTVNNPARPPVAANYFVQVRSGGTAPGNGFVFPRTDVNGNYGINVPAGTYLVRACSLGAGSVCTPDVSVTVNVPGGATQNFTFN